MNRLLIIAATGLAIYLPAIANAASKLATGVVAHSYGTYSQLNESNGEEVTCDGTGERLSTTTQKFSFLEGICDDATALSCGTQFQTVTEECFDTATDIVAAGSLLAVTSRGVTRICINEGGGDADCTDDGLITGGGDSTLIGLGETLTQTRFDLEKGGPASVTSEVTLSFNPEFSFGGEDLKLRFRQTIVYSTAQRAFELCRVSGLAEGCGVIGTSITINRPSR